MLQENKLYLSQVYFSWKFDNSKSANYSCRFGFNGQEKINEQYGEGNAYDFGARIQDPRLGRFLSIDPLKSKYPYLSPYVYARNKPIAKIDAGGMNEVTPPPPDVNVYIVVKSDNEIKTNNIQAGLHGNWHVVVVSDIENAAAAVQQVIGSSPISTLIIGSHGGYDSQDNVGFDLSPQYNATNDPNTSDIAVIARDIYDYMKEGATCCC